MANITKLSPRELTRNLNSFLELGSVMGDNQANRHLSKAGYRIAGDPEAKTINLFKYAAWLFDEIEAQERKITHPRTYDEIKEANRRRSSEVSTSGRDIGMIPKVGNPQRRESCRTDLGRFLKTYFPTAFFMPWSQDHRLVIKKIETALTKGGLFSLAMPRGTGKTTICEHSAIWATFYGYRHFPVIVGATEEAAAGILAVIKLEIETNELLAEDFPEVCYPVRCLEGINNRCAGQTCCGKRTRISWTDDLTLPTIDGSKASGATIRSVGITGNVRGKKVFRPEDGSEMRPDFVLIDDPQTDESAASPEQNKKRLKVVSGTILGLAGPGVKISGVMPCTVIRPGDLADQILDREKHPEWKGERCRLLLDFPENMELWKTYAKIWADSLREKESIADATDFYIQHRAEMDKGAVSSWPERYEPDEASAIQYAMNIYIRDKEVFYSEYQNQPIPDEDESAVDKITVQQVWDKMNNRPRAEIPLAAERVVMFIDVQKNLLYWIVAAFSQNFTGWVVDYGAFPDQKRRYFSLKDASPTYSSFHPGFGLEAALYASLKDLTDDYLSRIWRREDGAEMRIERCLVDSGWGRSTETVYQFCRESLHAAVLLPSKGQGITAAQKPFSEYRKNQGDRVGFNWIIPNVRKKRSIRYILYDTNFWKSFFRERLFTAAADPGSLSIYGSDEEQHRLLAEQFSSEISTPTAGRGRTVDIWKLLPGRENHWLDGIVGCMVAASELGCRIETDGFSRIAAFSPRTPAAVPKSAGPRHFSASGNHYSAGRHFSAK